MIESEKSPFALDKTLAVYGIRKNPFPIDEIDDFFFSTALLDKQLDALRNLAEYGELVLVISGIEGAGKTTLLNQVLLAADARWRCCRIDAHPSMSIDPMIDELLAGFGVKARGDDTVSDEALLRSHLAEANARNHVALLAVDDAHLMPQSCIEFLLGLAEQRGDTELRLLLTTEPGRLGFSTSDPKRVHVVVLEPFDLQQCGDYLNTRLSYAGLVGDGPFGAPVVDRIHQDSGGTPGEIHPLAVHSLISNADASGLRRRMPPMGHTMAYLALVLVAAGAVAFMMRAEPDLDSAVIRDPGATGVVKGRIVAETATGAIAAEETVATRVEAAQSPQPEPSAGSDGETRTAKAKPTETTKQPAATTEDDVKVFTVDGEPAATVAAVAVTAPAPAKGGTSASSGEPMVALAKNVTPAAVPTAPTVSPVVHDLDWLRRQDPSHYVIQLVGTRDASAARKFLDQHELGDKGTWIATSHENKPWFVVIYGMYPDHASARAAIVTLPERLRAGSPWPRTVASVVANAR